MAWDTSRSRPTVVLVGTLDTKGEEYALLRDRLAAAGVETVLVDVGTQRPPRTEPDVRREEVAAAGGIGLAALTDRGAAVQAMCAAAPGRRPPAVRRGPLPGRARRGRSGGEGGSFFDPEADAALLAGLRETLASSVEVHEVDAHTNDETFAVAMAARLDDLLGGRR